MAITRGPRKNSFKSVECRTAVMASRPCPINGNARIKMTRAAVIAVCRRYNDRKGGDLAGKRGPSICDTCETGAAIREGKRKFPLPIGITLYTKAEFDQLRAAALGGL